MIRSSTDGDCLIITLDRPDKANALTPDMLEKLAQTVEGATAKVVILTGTGRVFSAGADLDAARAGLAKSPLWERLSGAVANYAGLTITAINGTVAGGATGMVLACDLRISVAEAKFFYPVMRLGFLPQPSDVKRLGALVGPARTKFILMAGQKVPAGDALGWGLVDQIVPAEDLIGSAKVLASDALAASHAHITAIKRMI
ncbi:MAG: enoyl-CoA hydratase/isomerase family protein [Yoonia sp.]|nr:enoyl-CoA hydratase/isomerase family protein [Yoonia sp.]